MTYYGQLDTRQYDEYISAFAKLGIQTTGNMDWHLGSPAALEKQLGPEAFQRGPDGAIESRAILNIWNPAAMRYVRDIFRRCARYYGDHPNVVACEIMNEPGLYGGYSQHAKAAFRQWLQKQYGTIEKLNEVWGRGFRGFEEIEPPKSAGPPRIESSHQRIEAGDLHDFRSWRCLSFAEHLAMLVETLHDAAPTLAVSSQFSQHASWLRHDLGFDPFLVATLPKWDLLGMHDWFHSRTPHALANAGWWPACIERYTHTPLWEDEYPLLGLWDQATAPENVLRAGVNLIVWRYVAWGKRPVEPFAVDALEGQDTGGVQQTALISPESDYKIPYYRTGGLPAIERKVNSFREAIFPTRLASQGLALLRCRASHTLYGPQWHQGVNIATTPFVEMLWRKHWQAIMTPDECILDGREDLSQLRFIIAPQTTFAPDELQTKLLRWVEQGGVLLCSTPFGLFVPWGQPAGTLLRAVFGERAYTFDAEQGWSSPGLSRDAPCIRTLGRGTVILTLRPFPSLPNAEKALDDLLLKHLGPSIVHTDAAEVEVVMRSGPHGRGVVWAVNLSREKWANGELRLRGHWGRVVELTSESRPEVPVRHAGGFTWIPLCIGPGEGLCFALRQ